MAIVRPAITGDIIQDSWADQVTRALNTASINGGAGVIGGTGSGTGPAGTDGFNTATLYLFQRTGTDTAPAAVAVDTTYDFELGQLTDADGNAGSPTDDDPIDGLWFRAIPDEADGEFIWVTVVNIADQGNTEDIAASTWSVVSLLSRPGQDAVTVTLEARAADGNFNWVTLGNTIDASPNFKNDTAKEIGLVVRLYEAGFEVDSSVYTDDATTYAWTKNGADFTPSIDPQPTGAGKDMRVLLINEMDVAEGNINEVFTCQITY